MKVFCGNCDWLGPLKVFVGEIATQSFERGKIPWNSLSYARWATRGFIGVVPAARGQRSRSTKRFSTIGLPSPQLECLGYSAIESWWVSWRTLVWEQEFAFWSLWINAWSGIGRLPEFPDIWSKSRSYQVYPFQRAAIYQKSERSRSWIGPSNDSHCMSEVSYSC